MKTLVESGIVECGPGWDKLIQPVLDACAVEGVQITQIKEKYGTLRIYTGPAPDKIYSLIDTAEVQSAFTCETCGAPGTLQGHGWVYTACDLHIRKGYDP